MKNVMKIIMCVSFFCCANFGMQKEGGLYIECGKSPYIVYRGIGKDGCDYDIDDVTFNMLNVSNQFKGGDLMQSQDWKYCVQGRSDYASHIAVRRGTGENNAPLSLTSSDFLVPMALTEAQLKRVVKLCDAKRTVFVTGQHNSRLDIKSISFDTQGIRAQLQVDFAKKQEAERLERQKIQDKRDDAPGLCMCSEQSEGPITACCGLFCGFMMIFAFELSRCSSSPSAGRCEWYSKS